MHVLVNKNICIIFSLQLGSGSSTLQISFHILLLWRSYISLHLWLTPHTCDCMGLYQ